MMAVPDACVLVQNPIRDTLLRLAERSRLWEPRWTATIITETVRTLESKFGLTEAQTTRLTNALREHFPEAWVDGHEALIPYLKNHPKDRHVLAVAIQGNATVIITYNRRDFRPEDLAPWRVTAQSPATFLLSLYAWEPALVIQRLEEQARTLRRSLPEQLACLHPAAPPFIEQVARDLSLGMNFE